MANQNHINTTQEPRVQPGAGLALGARPSPSALVECWGCGLLLPAERPHISFNECESGYMPASPVCEVEP